MRDARNLPTPWSEHFVQTIDVDAARSMPGRVSDAAKIIYSFEAIRRIRRLIGLARPTIAHAHNIYHHLSPSILVELHRQGIPVVLTLHDLKIACPAYKMFAQGVVCERCRGGALRNVIQQRCIKGSLLMSSLVWLESSVHRRLNVYAGNVSKFVVPSRFFLTKLQEWGFDPAQFTHIPNFVDTDTLLPTEGGGKAFLYVGRLAPEKGIATLIRAAAQIRAPLIVAGTGPEEGKLRELAGRCGGDVTFTGHLNAAALYRTVGSARAVVLPSEWYENAPVSLMEASALGRPVIGASIGGIPELVREQETGWLFESGSVESLAAVLARVQTLPDRVLDEVGRAGRAWMQAEFTPRHYRDRVLALYGSLGARV